MVLNLILVFMMCLCNMYVTPESISRTDLGNKVVDDRLFAKFRACVCSNRNALASAEQRASMDLSLEELRVQGHGRDIFPSRAFFALQSALPVG